MRGGCKCVCVGAGGGGGGAGGHVLVCVRGGRVHACVCTHPQ